MRTFLTLLVGMVVSWSTGAQAESRTCWASSLCYKAGKSETEWLKIYPRLNCTSNPNIPKPVEHIRIQQKFNDSIVDFFKGIGDFARNTCLSCNLYQGIKEVDGHSYSEECFAPVVCGVDGRTVADFIQIRPFPSCKSGKKETNKTSGKMEMLFNSSREYVAKELQNFLFKNCNLCQTTRMENAIATLTKSLWKPSIDTKQCYAPVICKEGDYSLENWMRFPEPDCQSANLLLSEKPEKLFSSILERARAEIQDIMEEECSKSCDKKSSFSTTTLEAEYTTTPEILQRVSTKETTSAGNNKIRKQEMGTTSAALGPMLQTFITSESMLPTFTTFPNLAKSTDKGTTSAALESTLQSSTTSESMLPTSTTSPKTTLVPTTKKEFETSRATTTQESTTAGCTVLDNNNKTCNITYGGKCFILWNSGGQNVNLQGANQYCAMHGYQLGNIYDDCLFSHIMNQVGDKSGLLWTGMTVLFEKENQQVYLHSNQTAKFLPKWWYDGYPKTDGSNNLQIQIKLKVIPFPPSYLRGIINAPVSVRGNGALCEKDVDE